jgi:hypothetical protein
MSTYPAAGDYYKAVQAPARVFTVPKLQRAQFVWDSLGPTLARGSSAVVFQAAVDGVPQALRCYIRDDASSRDRYSALNAYLAGCDLSPYVSGAIWHDSAIRVNGATWPVLTMDWIDGRTLNEYVDYLVAGSNAAALATLAARWRELVTVLQDNQFGHGDLQHGNVMVDQEGRIRLVDFDGVWIPPLARHAPPTEYGHPNYQHPLSRVWGRWVDTFSALVIYLSLAALAKDPGLWLALYNSKNLLLSKADFAPPFKTEAWKQLAALRDPQVDELSRRLQECCAPGWVPDKSLEMTLGQQALTPTRQPRPAEQRWWEAKPAGSRADAGTGASSSGADPGGATAPLSWPWAQRPPSPGQQAPAGEAPTTVLPAPPPLSAPLGTAGTGPMPQPRKTAAPPGSTWWAGPGSGSSSSARSAPGPPPGVPGAPPGPKPPVPGPPAQVAKPQPRLAIGVISLIAGVVLLIAGNSSHHLPALIVLGLIASAWGVWRVVSLTGRNPKPPGKT